MSFRLRFRLLWLCTVAVSLAACASGRHGTSTADGGTGTSMSNAPTQTVLAPGAPANSADQFNGAESTGLAPTVLYPADGVLMPPNLSELEFQWTPAAGTTLFELHFVAPDLDLTVYTPCNTVGTGCGYEPDTTTWTLMSTQARGETMTLTMRAAGNGMVGTAASRTISFTEEDLLGGLYYWAAANGQIVRYDFGDRNQTAEIFYSAAEAGAICVGCHALSRDGSRIAVGLNAPVPVAGMQVLDIASKSVLFTATAGSNFESFSPDGSKILANAGGDLDLFDAATGTQIGTAPVITNGNLPDWSADGTQVVFAQNGSGGCPIPGLCDSVPGVLDAALFTVSVNGSTFGTPKEIVNGGGNNFYPGFSPDGAIVAFNRSASGADSFDASDATVWAVASTGGNPVALTNASSNAGDSWPKFAPYTHHFGSDTIFWLTFSSRRDYGLRLINSNKMVTTDPDGTTEDPRIAQVWMVAVPADAIMNGTMPSGGYPAFWLPFQSMASGNHIAQWVEKVARQTCVADGGGNCPSGESCVGGYCVGAPIQ